MNHLNDFLDMEVHGREAWSSRQHRSADGPLVQGNQRRGTGRVIQKDSIVLSASALCKVKAGKALRVQV